MDKLFNWSVIAMTAIGTFLATVFGGWDKWLMALLGLMVLDYITGLIKGGYHKRLSSQIGFKGICKKVLVLVCVALAVIVQNVTNLPVRDIVICFYVANEGISLIENMAEFIPIPKKLKDILLQLRDKSDGEVEEVEINE